MAKVKAVYAYVSKCCSAPATKPALVRNPDWRTAQPADFDGLGKWRCSHCRKNCKVSVNREGGSHAA